MQRSSLQSARFALFATLLWLSCAVFLWMFFSAERIERTASAGLFQALRGVDVTATAYRFAAEWRHGMIADWPLYMPGFFLVAMAAWLWCDLRPVRRLFWEGSFILALAGAAAAPLAAGERHRVALDLANHTGLYSRSGLLSPTWMGMLLAVLTLVSWSTFILACRFGLARKSFRPFLVPMVFAVALALSRPYTLNDAIALWMERALSGQAVPLLSLCLIPTAGLMLYAQHVLHQRSRGRQL